VICRLYPTIPDGAVSDHPWLGTMVLAAGCVGLWYGGVRRC